jgi:hypothetical protein
MNQSLLHFQSELPRSIPLFRYAPDRVRFSWQDWDPGHVQSSDDIPQYLILGDLDPSTFERSNSGWSARWQGTEDNTHFDVTYKANSSQWQIRQSWCGLNGGYSVIPVRMPLGKAIAEALYSQFPSLWDKQAKSQLESQYQISVIENPENAYNFCGIPDGAFRTIAFPIAVSNMRPVQQWINEIVEESPMSYPITIEAKLVFQAVNYIEGKAPKWTSQEAVAFNQSVKETGLVPLDFPVREKANDGSAAWTLRREIYFLLVRLPFAGLNDFLGRMASVNGPVRTTDDPNLRIELQPIVVPAGFEYQTGSLTLWDKLRTTRSFVRFSPLGETNDPPKVEDVIELEKIAPATLAKAESISREVVDAIRQIFQNAKKEDKS